MQEKSGLLSNASPKKSSRIYVPTGVKGLLYQFGIAESYCRVELYIDTKDKIRNEEIFDYLYKQKDEIEKSFKESLSWERHYKDRACKIVYRIDKNGFNEREWTDATDIIIGKMIDLDNSLKKHLETVNKN